MKIIFLNALNAHLRKPMEAFLRKHAPDTDVFCFQEAEDEMQRLCEAELSEYERVEATKMLYAKDHYFQATYVRRGLSVRSSPVLQDLPDMGLGLYTEISQKGRVAHVCNVHGIARFGNAPDDKKDAPGRIAQSRELLRFFEDKKGPRIIGGDLNVLPDTQSIRMFEESGYRNLVTEFGITTTRNELSWSRYPDRKLYYSDYVFVSPDLRVESFEVPNIEISDHLPMILRAEI